jgi:hypothetical protein
VGDGVDLYEYICNKKLLGYKPIVLQFGDIRFLHPLLELLQRII